MNETSSSKRTHPQIHNSLMVSSDVVDDILLGDHQRARLTEVDGIVLITKAFIKGT